MNPDGGYTRQYRRLWDHPCFRTKQEAAVLAWMISAAQWRETVIRTSVGPVRLGVGELLIAERALADDFGMHRNTVRTLIRRMLDEGIIERFLDRSPHRAGTVIRLVNYAQYQGLECAEATAVDRKRTEDGTAAGPKQDRKRTKNKEEKEVKEGKEEESDSSLRSESEGTSPTDPDPPPEMPACERSDDVAEAVAVWNATATDLGLPTCQKVTSGRRAAIRARLRDCGGLDGWRVAMERIRGSPFLTGRSGRGWKANIDWLVRETAFVRLMEGAYDDKNDRRPEGPGGEGSRRPAMAGFDELERMIADELRDDHPFG